jgi:protein SCO1/2
MIKPGIAFLYIAAAAGIVAWVKVAPKLLEGRPPITAAPTSPAPRTVPDFTLTDQRGQSVTKASLSGRIWLANFIFSSCPGPCLDLTKHMRDLQEVFASRERLVLVSFSIDPANDTLEKLAAYANQVGAGPRWLFLTGQRATTARIAKDGFLFPLSADPSSFDHSERIAVVDARGMVRGWFDSHSPELIASVSKLVEKLQTE